MLTTNSPPIAFALAAGLSNGGVTTWALNLSHRLNKQGYSSKLICHATWQGSSNFDVSDRDDIVRCDGQNAWEAGWNADANAIHSFLPTYSSLQPGIFIPNWSWGTWGTIALMSLHSGSDIRVIAFVHSDEDHYYELVTYYEPIIATFIAVSDTIHKTLERMFPSRSSDISKLLYPIPVMSERKKHDRFRPLTITYAGRIQQRQKRILDFIKLTKILSTQAGLYHFVIVGEGPALGQLVDFFKTNQYSNISCKFLGFVDHEKMTDIWANSDVCILFSDYEGMSISMAESMGQGCVPVVTDVSGARETIIHGETGFIFDVGDLSRAASFLQTLGTNRLTLEKMSCSCLSAIRYRGDFNRYDLDFISLVQQATTKRAAKWPAGKMIMPLRDQPSRSIYERVYARAGRLIRTFNLLPSRRR